MWRSYSANACPVIARPGHRRSGLPGARDGGRRRVGNHAVCVDGPWRHDVKLRGVPSEPYDPRMRVLIHIGATKTGSSAFQAYCDRHRQTLLGYGVLYPGAGVIDGAHHLLAAATHPMAHAMHADYFEAQSKPRAEVFRELAQGIQDEAQRLGCSTVLLSSEYLWGVMPEGVYAAWQEAFSDATVDIAAVLRRPDSWVQSKYLQAVKYGETRDFAAWHERAKANPYQGFDYYGVLKGWSAVASRGTVQVLVYEDLVAKGRFCHQLLEAMIGHPFADPLLAETDPVSNPSPNASTLELLLAVNRSDIRPETQKELRRVLMSTGEHRPVGSEIGLIPTRERLYILRDHVRAIEAVTTEFCPGRQKLFALEIHR